MCAVWPWGKYNVFGLRFSENGDNTCPTYFISSHGKKMEKQFKNYKALQKCED